MIDPRSMVGPALSGPERCRAALAAASKPKPGRELPKVGPISAQCAHVLQVETDGVRVCADCESVLESEPA